MHIFLFPGVILSKNQWIFTKLRLCIDILKIWFGIANGQFLTVLSVRDTSRFSNPDDNFSNLNGLSSSLLCALTL